MKKSLCSVKVLIAVLAILVIGSFSVFADYTGSNEAGYTWTISGFKFNLGLPGTIQGSGNTPKSVRWTVSAIDDVIFEQDKTWDSVVLTSPFQTAADVSTSIEINEIIYEKDGLTESKFNNSSEGESVTGTFVGLNTQVDAASAHTSSVSGGAIFSGLGMGTITGDFINNAASITTGESKGGAIYNTAVINKVNGSFIGNRAYAQEGTAKGGAIFSAVGEETKIGEIIGDFVGNLAFGANAFDDLEVKGGAIYNSRAIGSITGDFIGNRALAYSSDNAATAQGGAIFNTGDGAIIDDITGDFIGNSTESHVYGQKELKPENLWHNPEVPEYYYPQKPNKEQNAGGAIYNRGGLIKNISGSFIGNNASEGSAIYNTDSGTVHLSAKAENTEFAFDGNAIKVSDSGSVLIANNSDYAFYNTDKGTMSFTADTGDYLFANNGDFVIYNDNDGNLNLTAKDNHSITFQDGEELVSYGIWTIGKNTGDYKEATVTSGETIPSGTYYECNDQGVYSLTTDEEFQDDKEYYTLDEAYHGTITLDRVYGRTEEGPAVLSIYSGKVKGNDYLAQNAIRIYRDTADLENSKIFGELEIHADHPSVADGSYLENDGALTILGYGATNSTLKTAIKNIKTGGKASGVTNIKDGYVTYSPYTDGSFYRDQVTLVQKRLNVWDTSTLDIDARNLAVAESVSVNNNLGKVVLRNNFGSGGRKDGVFATLNNGIERMWFRGTEISLEDAYKDDGITLKDNVALYKVYEDKYTPEEAFDEDTGYLKDSYVVRYYNSSNQSVQSSEAFNADGSLNKDDGYYFNYTTLLTDATATAGEKFTIKAIELKDPIARRTAYSTHSDYSSHADGLVSQAYTFSTPVSEENAYSVSAMGEKKLVSGLKNIIVKPTDGEMPTIYEYAYKYYSEDTELTDKADIYDTDPISGEETLKNGVTVKEGFVQGSDFYELQYWDTTSSEYIVNKEDAYDGSELKSGVIKRYVFGESILDAYNSTTGELNTGFYSWYIKEDDTVSTVDYDSTEAENKVFYNASTNTFLTETEAFDQVPGGIANDAFLSAGTGAQLTIADHVFNNGKDIDLKVVNNARFWTNADRLKEQAKVTNNGILVLGGNLTTDDAGNITGGSGVLHNASVEEINHSSDGVVVGVKGNGIVEIDGNVKFETKVDASKIRIDGGKNLYSHVKYIGADIQTNGLYEDFIVHGYSEYLNRQGGGYLHLSGDDTKEGSQFNFNINYSYAGNYNISGIPSEKLNTAGQTTIEAGKIIFNSANVIRQQKLTIKEGATLEAKSWALKEILDQRSDHTNAPDYSSHYIDANNSIAYTDIINDGTLSLIGKEDAPRAVTKYVAGLKYYTVTPTTWATDVYEFKDGKYVATTDTQESHKDGEVYYTLTEATEITSFAANTTYAAKDPEDLSFKIFHNDVTGTGTVDIKAGEVELEHYSNGTTKQSAKLTQDRVTVQEAGTLSANADAFTLTSGIQNAGTVNLFGKTPDVTINEATKSTIALTTNIDGLNVGTTAPDYKYGTLNIKAQPTGENFYPIIIDAVTSPKSITQGAINIDNNVTLKINAGDISIVGTKDSNKIDNSGELNLNGTDATTGTFKTKVSGTGKTTITDGSKITLADGSLINQDIKFLPTTSSTLTVEKADSLGIGNTVSFEQPETPTNLSANVILNGGVLKTNIKSGDFTNTVTEYTDGTNTAEITTTIAADSTVAMGGKGTGSESAPIYVDHIVAGSGSTLDLSNNNPSSTTQGNYDDPTYDTIYIKSFDATVSGGLNFAFDIKSLSEYDHFVLPSDYTNTSVQGVINLTAVNVTDNFETPSNSVIHLFGVENSGLGAATSLTSGLTIPETTTIYDVYMYQFKQHDTIKGDIVVDRIPLADWTLQDMIATDTTYEKTYNISAFSFKNEDNAYSDGKSGFTWDWNSEDATGTATLTHALGTLKEYQVKESVIYPNSGKQYFPVADDQTYSSGTYYEKKISDDKLTVTYEEVTELSEGASIGSYYTLIDNSSELSSGASNLPRTFSIYGNGVTLSTGATGGEGDETRAYGISVSADDTLNLNDISFDGTFNFAASNAGKLNISAGSGKTSSILSPITNTNVLNVNGVFEDSVVKNKTTGTVTLSSVTGDAGTLNLNGGTLYLKKGKQTALNVHGANLVLGTVATDTFEVGSIKSDSAITNNGILTINGAEATTESVFGYQTTAADNKVLTGTGTVNITKGTAKFNGAVDSAELNIGLTGSATIAAKNLQATNVVNDGTLTLDDVVDYVAYTKDSSKTDEQNNAAKKLVAGTLGEDISGTGALSINGDVASAMTIAQGSVSVADGKTFTNTGNVTADSLANAGTFNNQGNGVTTVKTLSGAGTFTNSGTINVNTLNVTGTGDFENKGILNVNYDGSSFTLEKNLTDSQGTKTGVTNFNIADGKSLTLSNNITQNAINFGATELYYEIEGTVEGDGLTELEEGYFTSGSKTAVAAGTVAANGTTYYKLASNPTAIEGDVDTASYLKRTADGKFSVIDKVDPKAEAEVEYYKILAIETPTVVTDLGDGYWFTYDSANSKYVAVETPATAAAGTYYKIATEKDETITEGETVDTTQYVVKPNSDFVSIAKVNPLAVSAGSGSVTVSGATLTGAVTNNLIGGLIFTGATSVDGEFKGAGNTTIESKKVSDVETSIFSALASNLKLDNAITNNVIVKLSGGTLTGTPAATLQTSITGDGTTQIEAGSNITIGKTVKDSNVDATIGQNIKFLGKAALTANASSIGGAVTGTANEFEEDEVTVKTVNTADLNLTGGTLKFDVTGNVNTNIKNAVTLDGSLTVDTINVTKDGALSLLNKSTEQTVNVKNIVFADGSRILFDVKGGADQGDLKEVTETAAAASGTTYFSFTKLAKKPHILYGYYWLDGGEYKKANGTEEATDYYQLVVKDPSENEGENEGKALAGWYYRTNATNSNDTIVIANGGSATGKTRLGNINVIKDLFGNESVGDNKQSGKTTSFTLFDNSKNSTTNEIGLTIEGTTTSTDEKLYTFSQRTISDGDNKKYTGIIDVAIIPSQLTLQNIIAADTEIEGEEFIVDTYSLSRDYQLGESLFDIGNQESNTPNMTFVSCKDKEFKDGAEYYEKDELTGAYKKVDSPVSEMKDKYYVPTNYQKYSGGKIESGVTYYTKDEDGDFIKVVTPATDQLDNYYISSRQDTLGELGAYDTTRTLVLYGNGYSINAAKDAQTESQEARNADLSVKISGTGNTLELIDLGFKNFTGSGNSGSMINVSNGGTAKIVSDESKVSLTGSEGGDYAIGNVGGILDIVSYNTDSTKGVNFDTNSNILNNGIINIGETDEDGNALANGVVNLQKVNQTKVGDNTTAGTMNINSGIVNANDAITGGSLNVNGGTLNIALSNLNVDTNGAIKDDGTINLSGDGDLKHDFSGTGTLDFAGAVTSDTEDDETRTISLGTLSGNGSLANSGNLTVNVDKYSLATMTGEGTTTFVSNGTTSIGGSSLTQGAFNFGTTEKNTGVITVGADLTGDITNNIGKYENPNNTKGELPDSYQDALVISGSVNGNITNAANGIIVFQNDSQKSVGGEGKGIVTNNGLVALIDGDVDVNELDNKGVVEIDAASSMTVNTKFNNNGSEIKNLGTFTFGKENTHPAMTLDGILHGTGGNTVVNAYLTNNGKIEQKTVTVNTDAELHTKLSDIALSDNLLHNNGLVEIKDIPNEKNTLNLYIDGTGKLNFTGIQDIKFNSTIAGNEIVFKNGTMSFGANGDISGATLTLDEGAEYVDLNNDSREVNALGTLNLNTGVTFNMEMDMGTVVGAKVLDVDSGKTAMEISMDKLLINDGSTVGPNGSGTIAGISSDIKAKVTQRQYIADPFADDTTRDKLKDKFDIASREKILTPILYFTPDYDSEHGWITLTSEDNFGGFNPGLYAPAIASEMEGYYGMLSSFEDAFANSDMLMMTTVQPEASDIWIRPNFTIENVELLNGPEGGVNVRSAGALFGKDSKILEKVKDWKLVVSGFGSINRSSDSYMDFDIRSTTVRFGGKGMLYHGNFYLGSVVAAGVSLEDVDTPYGVDKFNMFSYGFAGKTGYNAQFLNGKLAIQPNLMASYVVATQSDFTTQSEVFLANDPTPAFEFTQGMKVIGNINDEWQVYLNGQYVKTFRNGTHQVAESVFVLPTLSVDSYWQYGGGVQKCLSDDVIFYVQFNGRTAGRLGVNITSGISF